MKLTKKKATEFCKKVFGTAKGLEQEGFSNTSYSIKLGEMSYNFWLLDQRIYVQFFICNYCFTSKYFNFDTFEHDYNYDENRDRKENDRAFAEDRLILLEDLKNKFFDEPAYKLYNEIDRLIEKYEVEGERY